MKSINLLFLVLFFSINSFGNRILFPNQQDFTFTSYSWICQVLNFNYKNSCYQHANYVRRPVKVGFLDTGMAQNLQIFKSYNIQETFSVLDSTKLNDNVGHGTQSISVFIDTINRIESQVGESIPFEIYPVKTTEDGKINSYNLIKGYFYLAHYINVDVINFSLSGSDYSIDEAKAFQYGANKFKSVLITAAGNEVYNLDKVNSYPCSYQSVNMVCVGSSNLNGSGIISNFGYDVDVLINGEKVRVVQKAGNFNRINGSSFSAPQISAYAAYALYKNPNLTYSEIKQMLIDSSYDKSLCMFSKSCGIFSFYKFKNLVLKSLH